jgi:hypothetical protein
MTDHSAAITAAGKLLDDFMTAFNARDIAAFDATFNFPSILLVSNKMSTVDKGHHTPEMFTQGPLADWGHSTWDRRTVVRADVKKVHFDCTFTRYRKDGSVMGTHESIYVVTNEDGHWGVKIRSGFLP